MVSVPIPEGSEHVDPSGFDWTAGGGLLLSTGDLGGTFVATQRADMSGFDLLWYLTSPSPVAIARLDGEDLVAVGEFPINVVSAFDPYTVAVPGTFLTYYWLDQNADLGSTDVFVRNLSEPFTYGSVNPSVSNLRYTTLDKIKSAMGIEGNDQDLAVQQAGISGEIQIDQTLGRSFPDTGSNPEILTVPIPIQQLALQAAIAVWKSAQAPFGSAGSDSYLGAISVENVIERELQRNPQLRGYQKAWGVA